MKPTESPANDIVLSEPYNLLFWHETGKLGGETKVPEKELLFTTMQTYLPSQRRTRAPGHFLSGQGFNKLIAEWELFGTVSKHWDQTCKLFPTLQKSSIKFAVQNFWREQWRKAYLENEPFLPLGLA